MTDARAVVVGAGPVGLTAALTLARAQVPVIVLESLPALATASRASTFHPATLDLLDGLGVGAGLRAQGRTVTRVQWRDIAGAVLAEMDFGLLAGLTGHPYRVHAEQTRLTPLLLAELDRLPGVDVRFGHTVEDVVNEPDGVRLRVATATGSQDLRADHLVAADGAHSTVRHRLGIDFPGIDYPHYVLRVITDTVLDRAIEGLAPLTYVRDPRQSYSLLGLPDHWRLIFRLPHDVPAARAVAAERVRELLRAALPAVPVTVRDAHTYRVSRRVLEHYRHGRVLFVGDAAHLTSTAGGMNMNAGLQDAAGAGQALADDDPAALDTWAEERRAALVDTVLPISEGRVAGIEGAAALRQAVERIVRTAADPDLARDYLARSSLLHPVAA